MRENDLFDYHTLTFRLIEQATCPSPNSLSARVLSFTQKRARRPSFFFSFFSVLFLVRTCDD